VNGCELSKLLSCGAVKGSRDDGRSWASTRVITASGGYSDVAVLPDGTILTLYEKSGLCLARFNLAWLEGAP
jgi:sialidase-1